jgi:hypothetical protein
VDKILRSDANGYATWKSATDLGLLTTIGNNTEVLFRDNNTSSKYNTNSGLTFNSGTSVLTINNIAIPTVYNDTQDPTGFVDGNNIDVSYNYANRTVTLTGTLDYYWRGVKKTLVSPWTSTGHTATVGGWFLSTTDGNNFTWAQTPWEFNVAQVVYVFYQSNSALTFAIRETHGLMPWQAHEEFHNQIGTYLNSGGRAINSTYSIGIPQNYATAPGFNSALVDDEDNQTFI